MAYKSVQLAAGLSVYFVRRKPWLDSLYLPQHSAHDAPGWSLARRLLGLCLVGRVTWGGAHHPSAMGAPFATAPDQFQAHAGFSRSGWSRRRSHAEFLLRRFLLDFFPSGRLAQGDGDRSQLRFSTE